MIFWYITLPNKETKTPFDKNVENKSQMVKLTMLNPCKNYYITIKMFYLIICKNKYNNKWDKVSYIEYEEKRYNFIFKI